jgi:hypothetical protein
MSQKEKPINKMAQYEVVAYQTTRHTMIVEANSPEEARSKADMHECVSDKWQDDFEYYDFSIVDAQEIKTKIK